LILDLTSNGLKVAMYGRLFFIMVCYTVIFLIIYLINNKFINLPSPVISGLIIILTIFYLSLLVRNFSANEIVINIKYFCLGVIFYNAIIFSSNLEFLSNNLHTYGTILHDVLFGVDVYAAQLSIYLIISLLILISARSHNKIIKLFENILVVLSILILIIYSSRASLLLIPLWIIFRGEVKVASIKMFFYILVLFPVIFYLVSQINPNTLEHISLRFFQFFMDTGDSGRSHLIGNFFNTLLDEPLGWTLPNASIDVFSYHNIIADSFRISGWIGGFFVLIFILITSIQLIYAYFKSPNSDIRLLALYGIFIIFLMNISVVWEGAYKLIFIHYLTVASINRG
jgi:hypothetical protein